jgi:general stress protein YciG
MAGTKAGGVKAALTNKTKHGSDFYAKIGAKGGKNGRTGGFAANPELARIAGAKGGRISRRTKKVVATNDSTLAA